MGCAISSRMPDGVQEPRTLDRYAPVSSTSEGVPPSSPWLDAKPVAEGIPVDTSRDLKRGYRRGLPRFIPVRGAITAAFPSRVDLAVFETREKKRETGLTTVDKDKASGRSGGRGRVEAWAVVSFNDSGTISEIREADKNPYRHPAVKQTGRIIAAAASWDIAVASKCPLADSMRLMKETCIWSEMYMTVEDAKK